jgi:Arylsulfotransferase (ASST)
MMMASGFISAFAAGPVLARTAPTCTPATPDNSALLGGAVTVSPLPGSRDAMPQTQISFLGVSSHALRSVRVVGSRTGTHAGRLRAYSQGDGASFLPARPFAPGERVSVRARLALRGAAREISDVFVVASPDPISSTPETVAPGTSAQQQGFRSRPDLHPPLVTVTASSPFLAPGDEFVAPYAGPGQAGPMILDPSGALVWFKPLPAHLAAANLRVQEFAGRPVLTWWQGDISVHGFGLGEGVIADDTYTDIAHVKAGNGLQADLHDFQLTPQGTALITAYEPIRCNLAAEGGSADGSVTDATLQEIDVRTGLVTFQWTSVDHVGLGESYEHARDSSAAAPFDFFHLNSIALDRDGSLLVSARNTWAAYDIDRATGRVLWQLGGKRSTFALGAGTHTAWQHDARPLADGSLSLFDNGASPKVHGQSRGVVVRLDAAHRTATLVDQLTHPPPLLADSQGNLQALSNGDWLIGWGQVGDFSELGPEGQLLFDAHFPAHDESYRSLRYVWTGRPAHRPALAVVPAAGGAATVYASWNGATLVASWRVLVGSSATSLAPVAQSARSGFETAIAVPQATAGRTVTVQAIDASGAVLGSANPVKVP